MRLLLSGCWPVRQEFLPVTKRPMAEIKMIARRMVHTLFLLMLMIAAGSASAQNDQPDDQPLWYGVDHGDQTRLIYGIPGSYGSTLIFICDKGSFDLSVYLDHPQVHASDGTILPVRLTDGQAAVEFEGTIQQLEMDDVFRVKGYFPLTQPFEALLADRGQGRQGQLTIDVGGVTLHYPLNGAEEAAAPLLALCGTAAQAQPPADLTVTAVNEARRNVANLALREPGSIEIDFDTFGYEGLAAGRQREFTIAGGAGVCTYEILVEYEEKEEDCCSDPLPTGQQNLCDDPRIVIHD